MKKAYTKPELYTVEYTTNTGFCGQCADEFEILNLFFEWDSSFDAAFLNAPDGCSDIIENHEGYCKYTSTTSTRIFTS